MKKVPPRPKFKEESDRYFLSVFNRAIDVQDHLVDLHGWQPKLRNDRVEIVKNWEKAGLGRCICSQDSHGGTFEIFSLSDDGIDYGRRLQARFDRSRLLTRLTKNFWPAFNGVGTWIAAFAAIAAAYFAYQGLQK